MGILQEILKTLSLPEFYFAMFRNVSKRDTGAFNDTGGYDLLEIRNQQHRP